jgi:integrase
MTDPTLQHRAEEYLRLRRSFGYHLKSHDRPLAEFVTYLSRAGLNTVTVESALAWAVEPDTTPLRRAQRLSIARGFATYLHALDPHCEVPPRGLLPEGRRRVPPHIYTEHEITGLMAESRRLRPPLRAATIETVIGLLVVTGLFSPGRRRCGGWSPRVRAGQRLTGETLSVATPVVQVDTPGLFVSCRVLVGTGPSSLLSRMDTHVCGVV